MARVVSTESVRFTPAQRDALIDVAARLQAEHEATVGAEELARAAREAGIDPRFLGEAAALLDRDVPVSFSATRSALVALGAFALFDLFFYEIATRSWVFPVAHFFRLPILAGAAVLFAVQFGRHRSLRWVAPLAVVSVWVFVGISSALIGRVAHGWRWMPISQVVAFGAIQAFCALVAATFAAWQDRGNR